MAIADDIINELRKKSGLTAMEIAVNIFGRRSRYNAVHRACRDLVDTGHLIKRGKGRQVDPFTYYLPRAT
jgi:hypothetical protein